MPGKPLHILGAAAGLALAACASSGNTNTSPTQEATIMEPTSQGELPPGYVRDYYTGKPIKAPAPVKEWPLRFKSHKFSVFTYDIYGAKVVYAGQTQIDQDDNKLQRSSASYGADYQKSWSGIHGMIRNFPPPAVVTWRSKDGQAHKAEIDIGEIFKDELIRHNVPREEMADLPDGEYSSEPSIMLEVNDRVIRVYMKALVPTKRPQVPDNPNSDARFESILVKTYTF